MDQGAPPQPADERPAGEVGGLAGGLDQFRRRRDERRAAPGELEVGAHTDRLEIGGTACHPRSSGSTTARQPPDRGERRV